VDIPHVPVLLDEIIASFSDIGDGIIVDCTVGYGGHSEAILKNNPNIKMICIDQDIEALAFSKERLKPYLDRITFLKGRFSDVINSIKDVENIKGILADIGVSSLQLDKEDRGFGFDSFTLDMRMDRDQKISAKDVVNCYDYDDLNRIFRDYGEVRDSKNVASLIVKQREIEPFTSSKQLAQFLSKHLYSGKKIHPATLVFQAIRIEVNDELGELKRLLQSIKKLDKDKCLVAIISFHSLEDRVVKSYFKDWAKSCICPKEVYRCMCGNNHSFGKIVTKKPIIPTDKEINENPRSRSSKLRLFKIQR
jgi:16S rRNA (cytosine1402-N4)-methyltransferase